jgi:UV DNA damage endonuclease
MSEPPLFRKPEPIEEARALRTVRYRLGFAVKVLGVDGMRVADTRRWQSGPHLRRSIELLGSVFDYLDRIDVRVYRLSSQTIPYGTHPDLRAFDFRRQLDEAAGELEGLAAGVRDLGLRLSTHPGQYTVLNARDPTIVELALAEVEQSAALLDRLGAGPEGTVVVHVGGEYGNRAEALDRWARAWDRLSDRARARLGLENDERSFSTYDVLTLHGRTGVRVVLDVHHHRIHPASASMPIRDALAAAFATWPSGVRPKVHLSSARTMLEAGTSSRPSFPPLRSHADLVLPWDLEALVTAAPAPVDVVLEAKAKDLALLELRRTLGVTRPDLAAAEERGFKSTSPI